MTRDTGFSEEERESNKVRRVTRGEENVGMGELPTYRSCIRDTVSFCLSTWRFADADLSQNCQEMRVSSTLIWLGRALSDLKLRATWIHEDLGAFSMCRRYVTFLSFIQYYLVC